MAIKATGSISIVDLTDGELQVILLSSLPSTIEFDAQGNPNPNWSVTPLTLTPQITFGNQTLTLPNNNITITYEKRRRQGNIQAIDGTTEIVNNSGVLTVNQNKLTDDNTDSITYYCKVNYNYNDTVYSSQDYLTFGAHELAEGLTIVDIQTQYYKSTSDTVLQGGSWSNTAESWENGYYFWTRFKLTWNDSSITYTDPIYNVNFTNSHQVTTVYSTEMTALEDRISTKVNETTSSLQDADESLRKLIKTNETTITQTSGEVQVAIGKTQTLETLIGDNKKATDNSLKQLQDDISTLEEKTTSFTMNDEGLTIAVNNSSFKTVITNAEIGFYEGSSKIAYLNNNQLHITTANITTSLKLGKFAFVPGTGASSDNLSLVWIG